jgi:hypothetical protein
MLRVENSVRIAGAGLVAKAHFSCGEVVHIFSDYRVNNSPTYQTIQISETEHIDNLDVLAYLNHSCSPNVYIDIATLSVVAVRSICPGEELTFFYPSTEWDMERPFVCQCGVAECLGIVSGAKYISPEILGRYEISGHILRMSIAASGKAS